VDQKAPSKKPIAPSKKKLVLDPILKLEEHRFKINKQAA
jgi:hypothetical protein